MPTTNNAALYRQFYAEVFDTRNLDLLDRFMAPDLFNHSTAPGMPQGIAGIRAIMEQYLTIFPDMQTTIEDVIATGDKVVGRLTACGTHQGGIHPQPTHKSFTVTEIEIIRFADGKMVERWANWDQLGMLQQLGFIPDHVTETL